MTTLHRHHWVKVRPHVVVINDPQAEEKGGETFNAVCTSCGAKAWLHWPYNTRSVDRP